MPPYAKRILFRGLSDDNLQLTNADSSCLGWEQPKRSVRINMDTQIRPVPHLKELTAEERKSLWFNRDEMEEIRDSLFQSIDKLEENRSFDGTLDTARGLESYTYSALQEKENKKLQLVRSLLQEQERQRQMGHYDEFELARISSEYGASSNVYAEYIAGRDAYFAHHGFEAEDDHDYCDEEDDQDDVLQQQAGLLRPVLMLCCWPFGLSSLKILRDD